MTYYRDGSPYEYWENLRADGLINVGWLDASEPYTAGPVERLFVESLKEICRNPILRTRGIHACTFCPPSVDPAAIFVESPNGQFRVGTAEIRVAGDGVTYASPDMIVHYVEAHGYRPPDAFIDSVIRTANNSG